MNTSVYSKNTPKSIQAMFNNIAKRYDLTNSVLSFRMHKKWNHELVHHVLLPRSPHTLLDLCCGTGDIAFDYLTTCSATCHAYLVDFCSGMLDCAKEKSKQLSLERHSLDYIEADVQRLPLASETVDCATMAYGIRNVQDPHQCIQEVYRVLKPGGRFGILELTQPQNRLLRLGHSCYLRLILPSLGKWLTANKEAYQYLRNSIQTFVSPADLENMLIDNKFVRTYRQPLAGGVATLLIGYKEF